MLLIESPAYTDSGKLKIGEQQSKIRLFHILRFYLAVTRHMQAFDTLLKVFGY